LTFSFIKIQVNVFEKKIIQGSKLNKMPLFVVVIVVCSHMVPYSSPSLMLNLSCGGEGVK
jgi:carboxypeptidase C (cathepsin A)